ncbi:hypothetical protein [Rudaeicoccus suwonensis]|uniref:Uncharacterized protein n=1 Tax=Rudaeicoccus suwonensis TaxID=657409 RepID=A0A561EC76_9MICO|nr:hypothetical protein [Rudaeicoccus suwonensis]TWE13215.1 hypothetical protein BKA23_2044 [Rudaeicoccus suwonensis]
MRTIGYAYPWDVLTPGFIERTTDLGVDSVAVALNYHSARCATPWSTTTSAIHARTSALYRNVGAHQWSDLQPGDASWMPQDDPGAAAIAVLAAAGVDTLAWIVLSHNSLVGEANPDIVVRNCFGESYPWALCPNNGRVQQFCGELTAASTAGLPLAGVVLESWGQMSAVHQCTHEKTDGVWSPEAVRLLSVCCCDACARGWQVPADHVRLTLAEAARAAIAGEPRPLPQDLDDLLLSTRHAGADRLRRTAINALPSSTSVTLHAGADPWATGALCGLTESATTDAAALVLPYWQPSEAALSAIATTRRQVPSTVAVGAYVTLAGPMERPEIASDVDQLATAGVDELHLYHLGLVGPGRWDQMRLAVDAARAPRHDSPHPPSAHDSSPADAIGIPNDSTRSKENA